MNKMEKIKGRITTLFPLVVLILLLCVQCTSEEFHLDMTSTVAGHIQTYDEFGNPTNDVGNITVMFDSLKSGITDSEGNYHIDNVPSGTYKVTVSKEGYESFSIDQYNVIATGDTIQLNQYINSYSGTEIKNFNVHWGDETHFWPYIDGVIVHNYPSGIFQSDYLPQEGSNYPLIYVFCSNDSTVSNTHYTWIWTSPVKVPSGGTFTFDYYQGGATMPYSSMPCYYVAYGASGYNSISNKPSKVIKILPK